MKSFLIRYWFLIFLALTATLLFFIKRGEKKAEGPLIFGLEPASGELLRPVDQVKIIFDREIEAEANEFSLTISPETEFEFSGKEKTLLIQLREPLSPGEKYFFELFWQSFPLYSWSYTVPLVSPTPKETEPSIVPERGDPDIQQEILERTEKNAPLIMEVPYENEDFYIDYIGPLKLEVRIKRGNEKEVKEKVYQWIRDKGIDPTTHQLFWIKASP